MFSFCGEFNFRFIKFPISLVKTFGPLRSARYERLASENACTSQVFTPSMIDIVRAGQSIDRGSLDSRRNTAARVAASRFMNGKGVARR